MVYLLGSNGESIQISPGQNTVGRSPTSSIVPSDNSTCSKNHAIITWSPGSNTAELEDLHSRNGTFWGPNQFELEKIFGKRNIKIGEYIQFGFSTILYQFVDKLDDDEVVEELLTIADRKMNDSEPLNSQEFVRFQMPASNSPSSPSQGQNMNISIQYPMAASSSSHPISIHIDPLAASRHDQALDLKNARVDSSLADGPVMASSASDVTRAVTSILAKNNYRDCEFEYDEWSFPDFVVMEAIAENMSGKQTAEVVVRRAVQDMEELQQQCLAGVSIDPDEHVSPEFEKVFLDTISSMLKRVAADLKVVVRSNLLKAIDRADKEGCDLPVLAILTRCSERLTRLISFQENPASLMSRSTQAEVFEVLWRVLGPLLLDLKKILDVLESIRSKIEHSDKGMVKGEHRMSAGSSAAGNRQLTKLSGELNDLRSLKGRKRSLKRFVSIFSTLFLNLKRVALERWKLLLKKSKQLLRLVLSKLRQCELLAMKAFAIWKHNVALSRCIGSAASQQYRLQIELLAYKARIHELSTSSDLMASLAAERALNKELSSTNAELRRSISELEAKYLELARGSVPQSQRLSMVRESFMQREEELVSERRRVSALTESVNILRKQIESFNVKPAETTDPDKTAGPAANKKVILRAGQSRSSPGFSQAGATHVVLFEVRRLGEALAAAERRSAQLEALINQHVSKSSQHDLVVQDLGARLSSWKMGLESLKNALTRKLGESGLLQLLHEIGPMDAGTSLLLQEFHRHPDMGTELKFDTRINRQSNLDQLLFG